MKAVVTGATGLLGRATYRELGNRDYEVLGTFFTREKEGLIKIDLCDHDQVTRLIAEFKPQVIIHCAAERRPDVAEKNPDAVIKLNVDATKHLSRVCKQHGVFMVYISTDYVFDGLNPPYYEDSPTNPLNFYGKSKLAGEQVIDQSHAILRVPVLYGETEWNGESAVNVLIDVILNKQKSAKMDHVQIRYPTCVNDIAVICAQLCGNSYSFIDFMKEKHVKGEKISGIFHFSAKQKMTKYEMCEILAGIWNIDLSHVTPVLEPPADATARPMNAHLASKRLEEMGIIVSFTDFAAFFRKFKDRKSN